MEAVSISKLSDLGAPLSFNSSVPVKVLKPPSCLPWAFEPTNLIWELSPVRATLPSLTGTPLACPPAADSSRLVELARKIASTNRARNSVLIRGLLVKDGNEVGEAYAASPRIAVKLPHFLWGRMGWSNSVPTWERLAGQTGPSAPQAETPLAIRGRSIPVLDLPSWALA